MLNLYTAEGGYLKEGGLGGGGGKTKKETRFAPNASLYSLLLSTVCKMPVCERKPTKAMGTQGIEASALYPYRELIEFESTSVDGNGQTGGREQGSGGCGGERG